MKNKGFLVRKQDQKTVEMLPGIFRTTLSYNDQSMVCHFVMHKGAVIPLHKHEAVQNGYMIKGKVRFFTKDEQNIIAEPGCGYVFNSNKEHGAEVLEDSELIECFTPMRSEYLV